jgi:hypothetical protein
MEEDEIEGDGEVEGDGEGEGEGDGVVEDGDDVEIATTQTTPATLLS